MGSGPVGMVRVRGAHRRAAYVGREPLRTGLIGIHMTRMLGRYVGRALQLWARSQSNDAVSVDGLGRIVDGWCRGG